MRIAIIKLSAMGDIIHAAVVLQFIKAVYPNSRIDWIVEEGFAPLLSGNTDIDAVHTVSLKRFKKEKRLNLLVTMIRELRALGPYDHIIDMQGLLKSAIIARLIGKNIHGFDRHSMREGAAAFFYRHTYAVSYDRNVILRGADLVSGSLDLRINESDLAAKKPFLFTNDDAKISVSEYTKRDKPLILVMVGASWASKIYPAELMAQVINELGHGALVIWGSEGEKAMAETILSLSPSARMAKKLTLPELIAVVEKADMVIGGDTGPVHMAWALNRPSVTVFGPTPSFRNTLTTGINEVVDTGKPVDPSNLDRHDMSIREIAPETIVSVAKSLLEKKQ